MDSIKIKLLAERDMLKEKLDNLDNFLLAEKVENVDDVQNVLLHVQAAAMNVYLQCLEERISRL